MTILRKTKDEREVCLREIAGSLFRPFDKADTVISEIFFQSSIDKFFRIIETIKIKVIQVYARKYINFNQCVRRAFHRALVSQFPQQRTHQRGFARTQVAIEPDNHARSQQWCDFAPQRNGRGLVRQKQLQRHWRGWKSTMMRTMQVNHSIKGVADLPHKNDFDGSALVEKIKNWGTSLGFSSIGIAHADVSLEAPGLWRWLEQGRHGEMDYMVKHADLRTQPAALMPGTLSIISARLPYWPQAVACEQVLTDTEMGYISRYALGRDYHKTVRTRLQRLADCIRDELSARHPEIPFNYRVFSDSAPVMEVEFARQSGIAWRGKHTLSLTRQGSWHFLGEIYTSLELPADSPISEHCGSCSRCLAACPTSAIVAPYEVDARRCISYLTIELHGPIPVELRPLIGNRIYGCDDCQLCCPWNRFAQAGDADFAVRHGLDAPQLIDLFAWSEEEFMQRLAGSPIRRIGHERWLRNIAVALGNAAPSPAIRAALMARQDHPSAVVREHVAWALSRML